MGQTAATCDRQPAAASFRGSHAHATLMLAVVTLFWGLSFPLMKNWLNAAEATNCPGGQIVAGLTVTALRTVLALILVAVFQPRWFLAPSLREWGVGLVIGLANCPACLVQVCGLADTSPAFSVIFTSLGSAWVPMLAWGLFRISVARLTLLGLALGIGGVAVLGIKEDLAWSLGRGEWLTLLASLLFAVVILMLDRLGRSARPGHLTVGFLAGTGLPALPLLAFWAGLSPEGTAWPSWTVSMLRSPTLALDVGLLTLFPTLPALHWMT